jgi:hypothetical protein
MGKKKVSFLQKVPHLTPFPFSPFPFSIREEKERNWRIGEEKAKDFSDT